MLPGGCTCPGVYLLGGWGVPAQGDVPVPGGCTWSWCCTCWGEGAPNPGGRYLPRYSPTCEQNSWHTLLKILPCPKLRLRAVIKHSLKLTILKSLRFRLCSTWRNLKGNSTLNVLTRRRRQGRSMRLSWHVRFYVYLYGISGPAALTVYWSTCLSKITDLRISSHATNLKNII